MSAVRGFTLPRAQSTEALAVFAPLRLWRMGPPFSWRQTIGSLACLAVGHHAPVTATELWNSEFRTWGRIADDAHAAFCGRCGRTLSPRFDMLRFR